ncbi:MAG: ammonium transporter [Deltaproteobacteria bacterium]|nr:ammonium transporter [Deltaproteobacteria bacterium]
MRPLIGIALSALCLVSSLTLAPALGAEETTAAPVAAAAEAEPVPAPAADAAIPAAPLAAAPAPALKIEAPASRQPDPSGANTGAAYDVKTGETSLLDLANAVGHNKVAINMMWVLLTGFLVMFMQAGFAMVETGFTRAKNACHTMAMNFMIYPLGMLGFFICGFAFMFGGLGGIGTMGGYDGLNHEISLHLFGKDFGILGWKGFFLSGSAYDVAVYALFLFQMVFMDTTATIPTGSMAERWKYSSFFLYGWFVGTIIYPIYGNWVWGGGWLATLGKNFALGHGHVDFAGSSVVHLTGGVLALVGGWIIGPRIGKYNRDGSVNAIPGHNIPMAIIGTFILAFGWFGFNPGSTLAGTDLRMAVVATNTMLASATGAMAATLWMWIFRTKKPDPSMMANGLLAGLVAITAPCAFVNAASACLIGLIAGIVVVEAAFFIDQKVKVDDPVGAIAVHGVNGIWGCLALGLFADGSYGDGWNGVPGAVTGLFYGDASQFLAQLIGVAANVVYVGIVGFIVFKVIDAVVGLRVSADQELEGLDVPEMGVVGYSGVVADKVVETPVSL